MEAYQPKRKAIFQQISKIGRYFTCSWYQKYSWITLCLTKRCFVCIADIVTSITHFCKLQINVTMHLLQAGFDNIKKALEKFLTHDTSASHTEAIMIWSTVSRPTVAQQLSNESAKILADRRLGLLNQLSAMKFILRQGIALRGHSENEGNLPQLLSAWTVNSAILKHWVKERKYMSHDIVNELVTLMGHNVLRKLLCRMKNQSPEWYSLDAPEHSFFTRAPTSNMSVLMTRKAPWSFLSILVLRELLAAPPLLLNCAGLLTPASFSGFLAP